MFKRCIAYNHELLLAGNMKQQSHVLQTSPNTWGGFKHTVTLVLRTSANLRAAWGRRLKISVEWAFYQSPKIMNGNELENARERGPT